MNQEVNTRLNMWINAFPRVAGVATIATGLLVILGWIFDIPMLTSVQSDLLSMKVNTALAFVLAGMSLLLFSAPEASIERKTARLLALLIGFIGLINIAEYVFTWDAGIDQLIFKETNMAPGTLYPGRMSLNTATSFCLFGLALITVQRKTRRGEGVAQIPALIVGLLGLLALLAYIYGLSGLSGYAIYTRMSLHTATSFILLSVGVLCLQPDVGVVAMITGEGPGGYMVRRLLLAAVGVPVVLGWLVVQGEMKGWYGNQFGDVIGATAYVAVFVFLVWTTGRSLNRLDAERRSLEQTLLRSEKEFKGLFDDAPVGYHELDSQGRITRMNQTELTSLGYQAGEMLGHFVWEFLDDQEASRRSILAKLAGTRPPAKGVERVYRRKDLTTITVVSEDKLLRDADGLITGIRTTLQDMTELKRTQKSLYESEERHRTLVQNLAEGVALVNDVEQFMFANPAAEAIFGVAPGRLVGQSLQEFMELDEFEKMREQTNKRRRGETASYEVQITRPDHEKRHLLVTVSPFIDSDGLFGGTFGIFRDLTERKRTEEALREAEAHYRLTVQNATDLIYNLDGKGCVTFANAATSRLIGYSPDDIAGRQYLDFVRPDFRKRAERNFFTQWLRKTPSVYFEAPILTKDGREVWLGQNVELIFKDNDVVGFLAVSRDITERKQSDKLAEALYTISQAIHSTDSLNELIEHIQRSLSSIMATNNFAIALLTDDGKRLTFLFERDEKGVDESISIDADDPQSLSVEVLRSMRPLLLGEKELHDRYSSGRNRVWVSAPKCWLGVPLMIGENAIGVMTVQDYSRGDRYGPKDLALIETAAGQIAIAIDRKRAQQEREKLIEELRTALENVRTLGGLVPICAHCKKIRDDKGYWNQLEKYLVEHTDAKLTHGLCPDCAKLYFPGLVPKT